MIAQQFMYLLKAHNQHIQKWSLAVGLWTAETGGIKSMHTCDTECKRKGKKKKPLTLQY